VARPRIRASAAPRPPRTIPPAHLPGGARFSDEDASFFDPVALVRLIKTDKRLGAVRDELAQAMVSHGHGPRRAPGDWALAYLAFGSGREANLQPWYRTVASNTALWRECGFQSVPAYQTVWQRFAELEQFADVFSRAQQHLMDIARGHDARIGMHWAVDGTESQTHAQPVHDCRDDDDCPTCRRKRQPHLPRVGVEEAIALRQHEAIVEESAAPEVPAPSSAPGLNPVPADGEREVTPDGIRFTSCGHWWFSRDLSAGTRRYNNGKVWHGHTNNKIVDVFTGAVISCLVTPANVNEHEAFPDIYEIGRQVVGCDPIAVITDRGYVTDAVAQFCTERDVTQVAPYRKRHRTAPASAQATERIDQHGIPLCKHCGTPGDFVRFVPGRSPRVAYRCPMPQTDECLTEQSIACSEDIRRILPIWRTSPVYGALRSQMGVREHAHEDMRTYFRVGGKSLRERQRRVGIACQQLRANAATFIQWMWVLVRQGWLGSRPERTQPVEIPTGGYLSRLLGRRNKHGLMGGGYPSRPSPKAGSAPPVAATPAP
jgi:hypothetical protein